MQPNFIWVIIAGAIGSIAAIGLEPHINKLAKKIKRKFKWPSK